MFQIFFTFLKISTTLQNLISLQFAEIAFIHFVVQQNTLERLQVSPLKFLYLVQWIEAISGDAW